MVCGVPPPSPSPSPSGSGRVVGGVPPPSPSPSPSGSGRVVGGVPLPSPSPSPSGSGRVVCGVPPPSPSPSPSGRDGLIMYAVRIVPLSKLPQTLHSRGLALILIDLELNDQWSKINVSQKNPGPAIFFCLIYISGRPKGVGAKRNS